MTPFKKITSAVAPLPIANVDTDVIIPKQFVKIVDRENLGHALFHDLRYLDNASENPDFILNKSGFRDAQILVVGHNFGPGSSREHAAWAMYDFGIRVIISTLFADIFHTNCINSGVLPITVQPPDLHSILSETEFNASHKFSVDLETQTITFPSGRVLKFEVALPNKQRLLKGVSETDETLLGSVDIWDSQIGFDVIQASF